MAKSHTQINKLIFYWSHGKRNSICWLCSPTESYCFSSFIGDKIHFLRSKTLWLKICDYLQWHKGWFPFLITWQRELSLVITLVILNDYNWANVEVGSMDWSSLFSSEMYSMKWEFLQKEDPHKKPKKHVKEKR